MKKSNIVIIAVAVTVIVVAVIGALVFLGMAGSFFSATGPPELKEASVAVSLGGGYDSATGLYNLEGIAQNMGKKDALNCSVEVTFFNVDTHADIKTAIVTIGDIPAESSKDINVSIQIPDGSALVSFRISDPVWA